MQLGVSYYPEITDETDWPTDLKHMRDAGLGVVRALEFAWSALEPREGVYDFDWCDRFVELAHCTGLRLILCTPTATPPAWLTTQYPEIMVVRRDGTQHVPGGRRDADIDNEIYRHYALEIAAQLGRRYGEHPAVIGWQIDNELIGPEGEPPECHSRASVFRFRQYLKQVHGDLATLNRRWGTRFWSQEYSDWGEVSTPLNNRSTMGQVLDYSRYFSHSLTEFVRLQAEGLRKIIAPRQWIGHNSTAVFDRGIDHVALSEPLDVAGWDAYPGAAGRPHAAAFTALAHDLFRSAKGKPFWVYETRAADAHLSDAYVAEMYVRGAAGVLMWHWREHRANAENESNAFCDHAGRPDVQRVQRTRSLVARLSDMPQVNAAERSPVALLFCPDCVRVQQTPDPYIQRAWSGRIGYLRVLIEVYHVLWRHGLRVDIVRPGDTLQGRRMLVAPSPRLLDRSACALVEQFVADGGTLLGVAKTAHQDRWGAYYNSPGEPLAAVLGFEQSRNVNLGATVEVAATLNDGRICACLPYAERVTPLEGCEVLARFADNAPTELAAAPAALQNRHGRGNSFYAAACSSGLLEMLLPLAASVAHVPIHKPAGDEVGILPVSATTACIFNHGAAPLNLGSRTIPPGGFDLCELASLQSA